MLLALAGVPAASIVEDYRVSAPNIAAAYQGWITAGETDTERDLRRALIASPPEAMAGVLEHLDVTHGGAGGYLRAAGVSDDALARVRTRLARADRVALDARCEASMRAQRLAQRGDQVTLEVSISRSDMGSSCSDGAGQCSPTSGRS